MTTRRTMRCVLPATMLCAMACLMVSPAPARAQSVLVTANGGELRYRGDTIWRVRDTTIWRTVVRGDTIFRTYYIHDQLRSTSTYVLFGDSALLVDERNAQGARSSEFKLPRSSPSIVPTSDIMMLEQAVRADAMERRRPMNFESPSAPRAPTEMQHYPFSANLNLAQRADTVWYIRGCAAAPPADTVTFVFVGGDSVRRVSPAPRTFGRYMTNAIRADMNSVVLRRRVAEIGATADDQIPRPRKWPCDKR